MNILDLRAHVEQRRGSRDQVKCLMNKLQHTVEDLEQKFQWHEQAREVVREVALKTQQKLQEHISNISSLALEAIYDDPYELAVEFVQRNNKTECDLWFCRDGGKIDPLSAAGGGVINVAAFALRVAAWSMQRPHSRSILILDEPFNNVSKDLLPRVGEMLKQISKQLSLQMLIITHADELIEAADRAFKVTMSKGVSNVSVI